MKNLRRKIIQAERNSIKRDQNMKRESSIDLDIVNQIDQKAKNAGYSLIKTRGINRASFTQLIDDNWDLLTQKGYLTNQESGFMLDITPLIQFQTNAIADVETGQFLTVSCIAKYLKRDRSGVSRMINSLTEKGILFEFVDVEEIKKYKRNIHERPLFVNPELFYKGNRNRIDAALVTLVDHFDKLEKSKVLLAWKVFRKPNESFGQLYRRKTFLKLKREYKHKTL